MLSSKTAKLHSDVALWVESERKAVRGAEESLHRSLSGELTCFVVLSKSLVQGKSKIIVPWDIIKIIK